MKKIKKNRNLIDVFSLLIVALILSMPVILSKTNIYNNEGIQHIARAYGTYESVKDNFFFPNIISTFSNGFGYSWMIFYGPIPTFGIVTVYLIIRNFVTAYKIFSFICMFLSGFFMYKFVKTITKINDIGLLSGIIYMCFPYHISSLYNNNNLSEFVSFIFVPIVFLGIYNIMYNDKKSNKFYYCIGLVGLILTQTAISIMVTIFSVAYILLRFEKTVEDKKTRNIIALNIIFVLLLTSFFWLPLLETRMKANYQIYENSLSDDKEDNGLKLMQLFITKNDSPAVYELGINILIMAVFSFMSIKIIYKPLKEHYIFFIICAIVCIFMSTKYFPWKYLPQFFLQNQMPYKMMIMTSFFLSIICSINMYLVIVKFNIKDVLVISIISLVYVFALYDIYFMNDIKINDIESYNLGLFSGKENEVVPGVGHGECLTVNSFKDKFYIATREDSIYVLKGKAIIEFEQKDKLKYYAKVKTFDSDYTIFECPYIYYPGYEVRIDGIIVNNFETENGFLGFAMGKEDDATIEIAYTGTEIMKKSKIISILSLIAFVVIYIKEYISLKNNEKKFIIEKIDEKKVEEKNV